MTENELSREAVSRPGPAGWGRPKDVPRRDVSGGSESFDPSHPPIFAGGVLFISNKSTLFAIKQGAQSGAAE